MIDFIEYVVSELKSKRLSKKNTLALIKQFSSHSASKTKAAAIHPLLHENTSILSQQSYSSTFTGNEFFLADHQVNLGGELTVKILPGVAYLEIARAAIEQAMPFPSAGTCLEINNIVWLQPVIVPDTADINIALYSNSDASEGIEYDIFSIKETETGEPQEVIHSQGQARFIDQQIIETLDIEQLKAQMTHNTLEASSVYSAFHDMGLHYGPAHQGVVTIYQGDNQLLAQLRLPEAVQSSKYDYLLHPSIIDSALQSTIGLSGDLQQISSEPSLPFALESLRIIAPCNQDMFAWVRYASGSQLGDKVIKLDIDLCDQAGNVCLQMRGFSSRVLSSDKAQLISKTAAMFEPSLITNAQENGCILANSIWEPCQAIPLSNTPEYVEQHILLCGLENIKTGELTSRLVNSQCNQLITENVNIADDYHQIALSCFERIRQIFEGKLKGKVLLQLAIANRDNQAIYAGLSGLFKTAALENPRFTGQIILVESATKIDDLVKQLSSEQQQIQDDYVKYEQGCRYALRWQDTVLNQQQANSAFKDIVAFKESGVYLITGGLGGLGVLFAREILQQTTKAKIIFTGRSALNEQKQTILDSLSAEEDQLDYQQLDLCDLVQVQRVIESIEAKHQKINGIIHSAGMIIDNFILKKTSEEFHQVLTPKVTGANVLDQASKDLDLDFFVLFSSGVSALGNIGQSDYAAANGFLDQFAAYRQQLVTDGKRQGKTLSINWPLWQNGGMQIDPSTRENMRAYTGMQPMQTMTGMSAFYQGLSLAHAQMFVMEGNLAKMRHTLSGDKTDTVIEKAITQPQETAKSPVIAPSSTDVLPVTTSANVMVLDEQTLTEKTQNYLREQFALLIKLAPHKIDPLAALENYGIDSILAMNLTSQLEKTFGSLPKTLFFEYQTVSELAQYIIQSFPEILTDLFAAPISVSTESRQTDHPQETATEKMSISAVSVKSGRQINRQRNHTFTPKRALSAVNTDPIAIVGLSGRYPESVNVDQYWQNLSQGKDCIVEVPKSRWDWQEHYNNNANQYGLHSSKWGGFIDGVDEFDPLFFNISPREAEYIDPQERLFLQHAWMAVEDAGYSRAELQVPYDQDQPGQVGVYVGVMYGEYNLSGSLASIANRVSYVLNLHGPSMTLDTMCSSSLTAIHLACQDLKQGRTSLAVAGGVNVSIHPSKYHMLSAGQFISSDGHCQSFGEGGDGYIPGEGVGAVILKRLAEAKQDGNHIYGLIKGSSLNHGGKTNGYTVPNPQAQSSSIIRALAESDTDVRHVSYIEAHGTGTKLGDPIEIAALSKAFKSNNPKSHAEEMLGYCAIGSAKSNIGHCESAAGIAGLTKILLQMKHKKIVPSLHSSELNPHIDFSKTPFIVNQTLKDWQQPIVDGNSQPRIAGLSSFGAGGSNAHMIIEEYSMTKGVYSADNSTVIVPLSARTSVQLKQKAQDLLDFITLDNTNSTAIDLFSMSYTLQVGREALEERVGFLVESSEQLIEKLQAYLAEEEDIVDVYQGQVKSNKDTLSLFSLDTDFQETVNKWITSRKLSKLIELWAKGLALDWQKLYGEIKPQRMSLPAYPFAKERYWIDPVNIGVSKAIAPTISQTTDLTFKTIHPLLHTNTSDFHQQSYASEFIGNEFFLKEENSGAKILSDVTYLEMARAAIAQATPLKSKDFELRLNNLFWGQPANIQQGKSINIALLSDDTSEHIHYDIYSGDGDEEVVHFQGQANFVSHHTLEQVDITALKVKMTVNSTVVLANVSTLYQGHKQLLAEIDIPSVANQTDDFVLHPMMMDNLLQIAAMGVIQSPVQTLFPVQLASLVMAAPVSNNMTVWARYSSNKESVDNSVSDQLAQLDIDLLNEQGVVCVQLKGLVLKSTVVNTSSHEEASIDNLVTIAPEKVAIFSSSAIEKPHDIKLLSLNSTLVSQARSTLAKPRSVTLMGQPVTLTTKFVAAKQEAASINIAVEPEKVAKQFSVTQSNDNNTESGDADISSIATYTPAQLQQQLIISLAKALYMDISDIDVDKSFVDLGLDSIVGVEWVNAINKQYGLTISATKVYDYSNIKELTTFLMKELGGNAAVKSAPLPILNQTSKPVVETVSDALPVTSATPLPTVSPTTTVAPAYPKARLQQELCLSLSDALYMDISEIENDKSFIDLGLDSIVGVEWVNAINKQYGLTISATKVYDYSNINELASYLEIELKSSSVNILEPAALPNKQEAEPLKVDQPVTFASVNANLPIIASVYPLLKRSIHTATQAIAKNHQYITSPANHIAPTFGHKTALDKVAIIGMSGKYAQAGNLEQYWDNLLAGKNAITEVPKARWDVDAYYDPDPTILGKVYCKWLGALDDIDCFDPLFFQISPAEAEGMDPQHRLFMQEAYRAFEDAGYSNKTLSNKKCGVYLGIMSNEYTFLQSSNKDSVDTTSNSFAIGAARIAYYLNLKGPAIPIDTACSSSMVAMHLGCQSLLNHETDLALAGGVSLYLTADSYLGMCQAGMLSPEGQCKSFDDGANGFVPGEGAGAIVLKRLQDAQADNDHIYGVILGSGVNQDGKTNGITAPSVNSQIELEREIYEKYNIDPESISYVETHGTGTKLGDPIELEALATVFSEKTTKKNYCALGSVKSNIGHSSGAAGVASVQKVLLSMQHKTLVPSLNVVKENTLFDFDNSPFYISKEKTDWHVEPDTLRRASISSFGFSGTNVHMVIEEYQPPTALEMASENASKIVDSQSAEVMIVLSARADEQLQQRAADLLHFLERNVERKVQSRDTLAFNLTEIAYTLQTGREEMKERLAIVSSSIEQLTQQLHAYVKGERNIRGLYQGQLNRSTDTFALFSADADLQETVEKWITRRSYEKLADLWVKGLNVDWSKFYLDHKPQRISLPTYPFAKQRYWLDVEPSITSISPSIAVVNTENMTQPVFPTAINSVDMIAEAVTEKTYYTPHWTMANLVTTPQESSTSIIVLAKTDVLCQAMKEQLAAQTDKNLNGSTVISVTFSKRYKQITATDFTVNPAQQEGFYQLLDALKGQDILPEHIIHEGVNSRDTDLNQWISDSGNLDEHLNESVYAIFYLSKALMKQKIKKSVKILSLFSSHQNIAVPQHSALAGFFKTLTLENPKYLTKLIEFQYSDTDQENIAEQSRLILDELQDECIDNNEIRYQCMDSNTATNRYLKSFVSCLPLEKPITDLPLKQNGVYIVTGGLGGLGYLFCEYLVNNFQAKLVLIGRSTLKGESEQKFNRLKSLNNDVVYLQADVANYDDVSSVVAQAKTQFSQIHGVIHSAGINRDSFIFNKSEAEVSAVLAAKVHGAVNLDRATKNEVLDLFVVFSSIAGVMGNIGQCDYAYANNFLDVFAQGRESLRKEQKCFGKTLSINWPLWQDGGMQLTEKEFAITEQKTGMKLLPTKEGFEYWEDFIQSEHTQGIALYGCPSKIAYYLTRESKPIDVNITSSTMTFDATTLKERTERYLTELISNEIKLAPELIDPEERFETFGIDSIMIGRFNVNLERDLGELPKTLLYEYATISELTAYLQEEAEPALAAMFNIENNINAAHVADVVKTQFSTTPEMISTLSIPVASACLEDVDDQIAIIGVHGRYPQSSTLDDYWNNLAQGKDLIDLVPKSRWDYEEFYHNDPAKAVEGSIYCKWGGFLDDFDKFDPRFFNIPVEDAKDIDPQERLFLESVWSAIEDSGYTKESLKEHFPKDKSADVGVFAGVTTNSYHLLAPEALNHGNVITPASLPWSIANRVSYYFDFQGPSIPVDTACSSSLVALHLACVSLKKKECQLAIAGGVNLYLHPSKYQSFCQKQMISFTGKNCSFGAGDNGFVPGEGVGTLVLKPLKRAIADEDNIYGVIAASAYEHSGRSNGYSIPNPNSQASLIHRTLQKGNIDPESISYIEGHGTGTQFGDSLEIAALTQAFEKQTSKKQFCAIGSVKSNIGHSESAAGIAGVAKILLQMKHRQLAPSINADELNANIDFDNSPFYLQKQLSPWLSSGNLPRRAIINSFGAGGVNACVILQDYEPKVVINEAQKSSDSLILISAKNKQGLQLLVKNLLSHLDKETPCIADLSYTLQIGREAMPERLALVVSDINELYQKLTLWCAQDNNTAIGSEHILTASLGAYRGRKPSLYDESQLTAIFASSDLNKLAAAWIHGDKVDWQQLYLENKPQRISLPCYPFAKERYWVTDNLMSQKSTNMKTESMQLHPLVSQNASTLKMVCFNSLLDEQAYYAQEHKVNGECIFPGAGFLEIACISGTIAGEQKVSKIRDIVWAHPLSFQYGDQMVQTYLKSIGESTEFEVTSLDDESERIIHAEGRLFFENNDKQLMGLEDNLSISALKARCTTSQGAADYYEQFKEQGFGYGPAFQAIQEFHLHESYALAKLSIDDTLKADFDRYMLHPSLIDGALQAVAGLIGATDSSTAYLPFALDEVAMVRPLTQECYAYVQTVDYEKNSASGIKKFNIQLLNERGELLMKLTNFYVRALEQVQTTQQDAMTV